MYKYILKNHFPLIYNLMKSFKKNIQFHFQRLLYSFLRFFKKDFQSPTQYVPSNLLFETDRSLGLSQWIFHDENWIRIKRFYEYQPLVNAGFQPKVVDNHQKPTNEVSFLKDGTIVFNEKTTNDYEWLYLFLDPEKYQWDNFSWKFSIRRDTYFRELQFAFRYQDLYNRYRCRFENNHIYFDKIINCKFYNEIGSVLFPMDLGVWYDVRIDIHENYFGCYVDDMLKIENFDKDLINGSIAIILWEDNGKTDIKAAVGPMTVHKLMSKKKFFSAISG